MCDACREDIECLCHYENKWKTALNKHLNRIEYVFIIPQWGNCRIREDVHMLDEEGCGAAVRDSVFVYLRL